MANLQGFNAETVEPHDTFDPIPAGEYPCLITQSEMKPTKSGGGAYLELELQVIEGPYAGRKLWDRLNLHNANETTVKIANSTLSSICRAVGVLRPNDSHELHDRPLVCRVRVEKRSDTDDSTNTVRGYKPYQPAVAPPAPRAAATPTPQRSPSVPPWKRPAAPAPVSAPPTASQGLRPDEVPF